MQARKAGEKAIAIWKKRKKKGKISAKSHFLISVRKSKV